MNTPALRKNNSGTVLIVVLVVLLSLSGLVFGMLEDAYDKGKGPAMMAQEHACGLSGEAAAKVAAALLAKDSDSTFDYPGDPWVAPFVRDELRIEISPCNARFNLNVGLLTPKGSDEMEKRDRERAVEGLFNLVSELKQDQELVLFLLDWLDNDKKERAAGSELFAYSEPYRGYGPRNDDLGTLEEAQLIYGWDKLPLESLRRFMTIYGDDSGKQSINVNFAPREVLEALLPELTPHMDKLLDHRRSKGFKHKDEIRTVLSIKDDTWKDIVDYVTVTSDTFRIMIETKSGSWRELRRYIVKRANTGKRITILHADILSSTSTF